MNLTEIITSVATVCPIIIIAISIISIIYHYIRKTKQENDEKIISTIYRHKLISDYCEGMDNTPCSMQSLYQEYKFKPEPTVEKVEVIVKPRHCECCGAPLKKDQHSCEYCGTEYF